MGWFKMTGQNPTAGYNAIGLAGLLSAATPTATASGRCWS